MKRATHAWDSEIRQRWLRSWSDRHGPVEEAGHAPVAARRRIGNRFPPPPLFLHEPGRFEGTQVETSRLGGCRQTLKSNVLDHKLRVVSQLPKHGRTGSTPAASTTATVPLYEECFRCTSIVHGSVRLSAVRRAGPPARGSAGASAAYSPRLPRRSVRRRSAPGPLPPAPAP